MKVDALQYSAKLKATIQGTGRLGFTKETITELRLTADKSVTLAFDSDSADVLYMAVLDYKDPHAFKIIRAGEYIYLPTTQFFDAIGLEYKGDGNVMFDLARCEMYDAELGGVCYKMSKRLPYRPKKSVD